MKHITCFNIVFILMTLISSQGYCFGIEDDAKNNVKRLLVDPESVKFENLQVVINSNGNKAVCGEVNAKNALGGYTGFTEFSFSDGNVIMLSAFSDGSALMEYELTGCAGEEKQKIAKLSKNLIEESKIKVTELLKNKDNPLFKNLKLVINVDNKAAVCGEVNAKNVFGGYTGFIKFSFSDGVVTIPDEADASYYTESVETFNLAGCSGEEKQLISKLKREGFFNCKISWDLLSNIINNMPEDEALDLAMDATKMRFEKVYGVLTHENEQQLRSQYTNAIPIMLSDKSGIEKIKENPDNEMKNFINTCISEYMKLIKPNLNKITNQ